MDLGTLLLAAFKRKMKISNYKDGLRLVFANAATFNHDSALMVNLAKHLDRFACGLYEEAFAQPYRALPLVEPDKFQYYRDVSRLYLYTLLQGEVLSLSECKLLIEALQKAKIAGHPTSAPGEGEENASPFVAALESSLQPISLGVEAYQVRHRAPDSSPASLILFDL